MKFSTYRLTVKDSETLPRVLFGIAKDQIAEGIEVSHYPDFIGNESDSPTENGYVRLYRGIYRHPTNPKKIVLFSGNSKPTTFNDEDSAMAELWSRISRSNKQLNSTVGDLKRHYSQQKYSLSDRDAIKSYTHFMADINHRILSGNLEPVHHDMIQSIDKAVSREHTPDDMVVYSGTNNHHADILRKHDTVIHPSYLSSSLCVSKASTFANDRGGDVVKIHIPHGHPGVFAGDMSSIPSEHEFILPRNVTLHIDHSKQQVISNDLAKKTIYVHHAYIKDNT